MPTMLEQLATGQKHDPAILLPNAWYALLRTVETVCPCGSTTSVRNGVLTTHGPKSTWDTNGTWRAVIRDAYDERHEVTVSTVTEHLDDSTSVRHQYADPVDHAHYTYSASVHVTYRAPRCPHGHDWRWCERRPCVDCEWLAEIDTAYMGNAPGRAAS